MKGLEKIIEKSIEEKRGIDTINKIMEIANFAGTDSYRTLYNTAMRLEKMDLENYTNGVSNREIYEKKHDVLCKKLIAYVGESLGMTEGDETGQLRRFNLGICDSKVQCTFSTYLENGRIYFEAELNPDSVKITRLWGNYKSKQIDEDSEDVQVFYDSFNKSRLKKLKPFLKKISKETQEENNSSEGLNPSELRSIMDMRGRFQ